jgi:hypothetical protein
MGRHEGLQVVPVSDQLFELDIAMRAGGEDGGRGKGEDDEREVTQERMPAVSLRAEAVFAAGRHVSPSRLAQPSRR